MTGQDQRDEQAAGSRCHERARQLGHQFLDPGVTVGAGGHPLVAAGSQHVGPVPGFEPVTQVTGLAVGFVGGEPRERHPGIEGSLQRRDHLPRFRGEPDLVTDPGGPAAVAVAGPGLG